jgi:hypothetical protein
MRLSHTSNGSLITAMLLTLLFRSLTPCLEPPTVDQGLPSALGDAGFTPSERIISVLESRDAWAPGIWFAPG